MRLALGLKSIASESADLIVETGIGNHPLHVIAVAVDGKLEQVDALGGPFAFDVPGLRPSR